MTVSLADLDEQKAEIDTFRPFSEHVAKQLKDYYRIGFSYASNALEGNSLTESETKVVIEDGLTIGGKPIRDHLEALGHGEAYDQLYRLVQNSAIQVVDILELHRLFFYRIDASQAGSYRKVSIIVTGTDHEFPAPHELPQQITQLEANIPLLKKSLHPVEFAARLHVEIVNIHPFVDGNGRTARLAMNLALMQTGFGIAVIPPILRAKYIAATAQANKGKNLPFLELMRGVLWESQKDLLRMLRSLNRS